MRSSDISYEHLCIVTGENGLPGLPGKEGLPGYPGEKGNLPLEVLKS